MTKRVAKRISPESRSRVKLYLKLIVRLHHLTITKVSRGLKHNKSYLNTSLDTLNVNPLTKILKKIANYLNAPAVNLVSVLYGNTKLIKQAQHACAKQIGVPYLKKHLTDKQLKKALSAKDYQQTLAHANPSNEAIVKLSKMMNISSVTLGKKFGMSNSQLKSLRKMGIYPINRALAKYREKNHLSQQAVARDLGIYQTAVSGYERQHMPRPLTIFKLARIYNTTPLHLLKFMKSYQYIQAKSPAYKIMTLCDKHDLSSNSFSRVIHEPTYMTINVLESRQRNNSRINNKYANQVIKTFHLPKDFFGATETKATRRANEFKDKALKSGIKPNYFGYKLMVKLLTNGLTLRSFANKFNLKYYGHKRDKKHHIGITYQTVQLMKSAKTPHTPREKQVAEFVKTLNI